MLINIYTRPGHESFDAQASPVDNAAEPRMTVSSSTNRREGTLRRFVELPPTLEILFAVHRDHQHVSST